MQSAPCSAGSTAWIDVQPVVVDDHELAGAHLALERRADEVERARLGGDDGVVAEPAEHERPEAVRVAEGEELAVGEPDDGRRALEPRHRRGDRLLERPLVVGDQRRDHLGVGARGERLADLARAAPRRSRGCRCGRARPCAPRPWWSSGCAFAQALPPVVE